ncbi:MAG: DUF2007 domain-containing protein [Verrucomicrobia bacterium]|nr:DUF2007 domain-containing protein [Verrucomicrobiota bacterium]
MDMVTVFQTFSIAEAQVVRSRLEASEMHPTLLNEVASVSIDGYTMSTGGVRVQVPDDEAVAARQLIESGNDTTETAA